MDIGLDTHLSIHLRLILSQPDISNIFRKMRNRITYNC